MKIEIENSFDSYIRNRELNNLKIHLNPKTLLPIQFKNSIQFQYHVYSCQFSTNGNYCYVATQDHSIAFYDTSDLTFRPSIKFKASRGRWTITDHAISPDNRFIAYSSLVPYINLAQISEDGFTLEEGSQRILDFKENGNGFAIWSVRFSGDGQELVAGSNDESIYVYNIELGKLLHRIEGHTEDVNSVAYIDPKDPNVLVSGSDDNMIKIWDRRSMGKMGSRPAGLLIGHTEGITHLSAKGDGRYIVSNGKDQTMKVWDIRRMKSADFDHEGCRLTHMSWDYRWQHYPRRTPRKHPHDNSVRTFQGHSVLRTLIRCYFSPVYSTGQRYVYTGSADGFIYIYSLEGDEIIKIDTTVDSTTDEEELDDDYSYYDGQNLVRDVSWHPFAPVLICSQWSQGGGGKVLSFEK
ncbi:WD40-repeat-containing domain protein [Globomyces pollinis-pini]|nr:WD40-repeat-containing domain protein [Globomyces pollinis-pini]